MSDQKISEPLVSRLQKDGKIAAVNDRLDMTQFAQAFDQIAEVGDHLRGAPGEVHGLDVRASEPFDDSIDSLTRDDLFTLRTRVNVAMDARKIAELAEVKLKDLGSPALERQLMICQRLGKASSVSVGFYRQRAAVISVAS